MQSNIKNLIDRVGNKAVLRVSQSDVYDVATRTNQQVLVDHDVKLVIFDAKSVPISGDILCDSDELNIYMAADNAAIVPKENDKLLLADYQYNIGDVKPQYHQDKVLMYSITALK